MLLTSRSPTLRLKIPFWEGEWRCELYDMGEKQIFPDVDNPDVTPKDLVAKATQVAVVMLNGGLWFANGKFGTTWKLFQAVVKPKTTLRGKCHVKLSDADKQKLSSQKTEEESDADTEDSDDDNDVQQEVAKELEETPKVVKKRKVVRRKKKADAVDE